MTRLTLSQPDAPPAPAVFEAAQERLRRLGARVTQPRLCILACLIGSDDALTHQAVIDRLPAQGKGETIDRVTVYRVLDWLVEQGVAQKRAGNDRVFRFSLVEHEAARARCIASTAISTARAATARSASMTPACRRSPPPRACRAASPSNMSN